MVDKFVKLSGIIFEFGGHVSFEWPRFCDGWTDSHVSSALQTLPLTEVKFDGCMLGVCSNFGDTKGFPIKKPWMVKTTSAVFHSKCSQMLCDKSHIHAPCAGRDTVQTGLYNEHFVGIVVDSMIESKPFEHLKQIPPTSCNVCCPGVEIIPEVAEEVCDDAFLEPLCIQSEDMFGHDGIDNDRQLIAAEPYDHLSTTHLLLYNTKCSCASCNAGLSRMSPARRAPKDKVRSRKPSTSFGDIYGDHLIVKEKSQGNNGERAGLCLRDRFTGWMTNGASRHKGETSSTLTVLEMIGKEPISELRSDCSPELIAVGKAFKVPHSTATPYRPESNGESEALVYKNISHTTCSLHRSGLPHVAWPYAFDYYAICSNILEEYTQPGTDDQSKLTPYERRHDSDFLGSLVPLGSLVSFKTVDAKSCKRRRKFESRQEESVFMGIHLNPGGKWSGDYLCCKVADFVELGYKQIPRVFRVRDVVFPRGEFKFPLFDARQAATHEALKNRVIHAIEEVKGVVIQNNDDIPDNVISDILAEDKTSNADAFGINGLDAADQAVEDQTNIDRAAALDIRPRKRSKGTARPPDVWIEDWKKWSAQRKSAELALRAKDVPMDDAEIAAVVRCDLNWNGRKRMKAKKFHKHMELLAEKCDKIDSDLRKYGPFHVHHSRNSHHNPFNRNCLVTLNLDFKDPRSRSAQANEAVETELGKLRGRTVWDEDGVVEWSWVRENHPDAQVGNLSPLVGIKNSEGTEDEWKWKGRIVFGGHNIRSAQGARVALFNDSSAAPASMVATRSLIALACLKKGYRVKQSDCHSAYNQCP